MRSIGARLALWYTLAATVAFAGLSVAGYFMLERYLVHGLDLLNAAEFEQIKAHLGPDHETLSTAVIETRIRETTEYASVLFYIDVHGKTVGTVFRSSNLHGETIPDIPGQRIFNAGLPDKGLMRVGEFILAPYDVMVATPLAPVLSVMEGYVEVCAALMAIMLVVSAALGFGLSRLALRPLRSIQSTANRIRSDNLTERIPVANVSDEISNLARLLNQMFDRLESAFNQIRRFSADASHELKTPLSLMRLHAEKMLMEGGLSQGQQEAVAAQLEELDRLNEIVEDLLFLSRAEARAITLHPQLQAPTLFLLSFEQDARVLAEHEDVQCTLLHRGDGAVSFDPKWIRQVLLNLGAFNWARSPTYRIPRWAKVISLIVGIAMFVWPLVHRDPITNLTLWCSLVFLLDPINLKLRRPSMFGDWQRGWYGRTLAAFSGGLICGLLWEFWNYWALAKWTYHLPFLGSAEHYRYFEMPIIGLLGFLPFGIECWIMWQMLRIPLDGLAEELPNDRKLI